jgi:hypothetical protein
MNNEKGTIYLIQPAELVGTERYKIGCSTKNDLERCKKGYKKGTRFIDIRECDEPFALEREVKNRFNTKFKLVAGKEYFEGNEYDIKKEFNDVLCKIISNADKSKVPNISTSIKAQDEIILDVDNKYFTFMCEKISLDPTLKSTKASICAIFPIDAKIDEDELKAAHQNPEEWLYNNATELYIDCSDNFDKEEQLLIQKYNIQSLEDLLKCKNITSHEKTRALNCYKYVCDRTKLMGIEPFNGNTCIQIDKYIFCIKISFDRKVKFINSLGIKTYDKFSIISLV